MEFPPEWVTPFSDFNDQFLQVLLTKFEITRQSRGARLDVTIDSRQPTIRHRTAKGVLRDSIPDFAQKAADYQRALDAFLIGGTPGTFRHDDPDFPFRYCSGGTLPIVRLNRKDYYCLFYREIFPIGWNVANGGSDSRIELLSPQDIIERELREELMVFDLDRRTRYSFSWYTGKPLDRPEFAVARRFWQERFKDDLSNFKEVELPLTWLDGPDSLNVGITDSPGRVLIDNCFLNVNALDFGIEIDRIARISLDDDAVLLDGEILQGTLVNAPIGLFPVEKLNDSLKNRVAAFVPEILFFDGVRHAGSDLDWVLERFIATMKGIVPDRELKLWSDCRAKHDLCPVTGRLIRRTLARRETPPPSVAGNYHVFVSFCGSAVEVARPVYQRANDRFPGKVFFSDQTMHDTNFGREISAALDSATRLIVVTNDAGCVRTGWPEFEWRTFHQEICNGRKPDGQILSVVYGLDWPDLPIELRNRQVVPWDPANPDGALNAILQFIR